MDFSIHLYSRYREEFAECGEQQAALIRAFECAGPPCFTAAVTSAGGFLALRFAGFVGFQQLGLVLAAGVLLCLFAVVTVLPLMILLLDNKVSDQNLLRPSFSTNVEVKYRSAKWWILGLFVTSMLAWTIIPKIAFEYDLSALRPNGLAYNELTVAERSVVRKSFQPIVVSTNSSEDLITAQSHDKYWMMTHRTICIKRFRFILFCLQIKSTDWSC